MFLFFCKRKLFYHTPEKTTIQIYGEMIENNLENE